MAVERARPAWQGSDRRERLPANWPQLRRDARKRNPERICHWCGAPGGADLDHKNGNWRDNRPENLDFIHGRADYLAGRSTKNCHGQKTGREASAAAAANRRALNPPTVHPSLR